MKTPKTLLLITVIALLITACQPTITKQEPIENNDGLLLATLFMQRSSEYQALCYQAYNWGQLRLDEKLNAYNGEKKLAVVVDIDETVLDNSPFSAKSIIENTDYPKYWDEWCEKAEAKSIPGAVEFLKYAESKGVETFYISNRKVHLIAPTLLNLQNNGFPFADSTHIMLRTTSSDKEERRNKVREDFDVLLYFGDNLGDFMSVFDGKNTKDRNALTLEMKEKFGDQFIVLPNPTYGGWMDAMKTGLPKNIDTDSLYKARLINF